MTTPTPKTVPIMSRLYVRFPGTRRWSPAALVAGLVISLAPTLDDAYVFTAAERHRLDGGTLRAHCGSAVDYKFAAVGW